MALSINEEIYYRNAVGGDFGELPSSDIVDDFSISTTQSTVTLSKTPSGASPIFVLKNGKLLRYTTDYTVTGTTVTFVVNLLSGDVIVATYSI